MDTFLADASEAAQNERHVRVTVARYDWYGHSVNMKHGSELKMTVVAKRRVAPWKKRREEVKKRRGQEESNVKWKM